MDPNDVPAEEENDHVASMRHQTRIVFSRLGHLASPVPPPRLPTKKKAVRPDSSIIGECTVCYNTVPTTKRTCCGTSVCNDCMDEYLTGCINKGVYKISCIGCDVIMPHDEVKPKLTRNARTLARTRLSYLRVHHGEDPNRKACPFCNVISNFEEGLKNYFEKYESIVVCPECEKEWCYSCEVPWHSGLTCGEFHASKVNTKVESWADERRLGGQRNAIKCPECRVYVIMDPNDVPAEGENYHVASIRHQTQILFSRLGHLASPVPPPRLPTKKKDVRPDSSIIGECTVCYNTVPTTKRTCCGTSVCNDCMDEYLTGCINKGVYKIPCIGCDIIMPYDEVKPKLTRNARTRLNYLRVHHGEDPNRKACPFCNVISNFEEGLKNYFEKYESIVVCPECDKEWCYSCEVPWHSGLTCGEFHASKVNTKVESWAERRRLGGQRNAIKCPECGVYIQRIEGCYMMSCSQCKTKCCYDCGDRVPHPNTSKCGKVGGAHDPRPATAPPVARVARVPRGRYINQPKPRRQYCECLKTYWWMILLIVIWLVGTYVFVGFAPSIVSGRL